jgi:hypothetical protein
MFVRDFIEIPQPFEAVAPRLVCNAAWLNPFLHAALEEAVSTLGALSTDEPLTLRLAPLTVRCGRGPVRLRADTLVMPLRWETNLPAFLVPDVDGELEVAPLGVVRSQLALNANAGPSSPGQDDIARRVMETELRAFLRHLAAEFQPMS